MVRLVGVLERTLLRGWAAPTAVIGIPIGPPSQNPEPKSACMVFAGPIVATVAAEPAATGSASTRRFQGLLAGKTLHAFAPGIGLARAARRGDGGGDAAMTAVARGSGVYRGSAPA